MRIFRFFFGLIKTNLFLSGWHDHHGVFGGTIIGSGKHEGVHAGAVHKSGGGGEHVIFDHGHYTDVLKASDGGGGEGGHHFEVISSGGGGGGGGELFGHH